MRQQPGVCVGGTDCTMICWSCQLEGGTPRTRRDKGQADHARVYSHLLRSKEQVGPMPVCGGLGKRMEKKPSLFKTVISYDIPYTRLLF